MRVEERGQIEPTQIERIQIERGVRRNGMCDRQRVNGAIGVSGGRGRRLASLAYKPHRARHLPAPAPGLKHVTNAYLAITHPHLTWPRHLRRLVLFIEYMLAGDVPYTCFRHSSASVMGPAFMYMFVLITVIMLLNMLIALYAAGHRCSQATRTGSHERGVLWRVVCGVWV